VDWLVEANVSEKRAVSFFRVKVTSDVIQDEDNMFLQNAGFYQPVYSAHKPQRTSSYQSQIRFLKRNTALEFLAVATLQSKESTVIHVMVKCNVFMHMY
jgi:hypothetical protein